jgi:hypothetical protein
VCIQSILPDGNLKRSMFEDCPGRIVCVRDGGYL